MAQFRAEMLVAHLMMAIPAALQLLPNTRSNNCTKHFSENSFANYCSFHKMREMWGTSDVGYLITSGWPQQWPTLLPYTMEMAAPCQNRVFLNHFPILFNFKNNVSLEGETRKLMNTTPSSCDFSSLTTSYSE